MEGTTVWSFPHRGDWATHKGDYRGNWPPQMARNIILRYSKPKELVLDQMCGSGTTMIECKLLGRNGIGVDINPAALMLTRDRLNFKNPTSLQVPKTFQRTYIGDARKLNLIETESVDLIATHPPYTNIVPYSKEKLAVDLSSVHNVGKYVDEMRTVASESLRVLKPGRYMAILVGDTRRGKHYVPVAFRIMHMFLETGFILKEDIVKLQWRCKATPFWLKKSIEANFFLLMHEHLFVFRKPESEEDISKFQGSAAW
ncbi:MAG: TRM11 family SAM-dependent methyltransferase [Candidatus Bathyarchaeia archaeon]